jgi:hypothetical protein
MLWRRKRVSELASTLPTLTMQSLLMAGACVDVEATHPPRALRAEHVRDAAKWVDAGCPWLYGHPATEEVVPVKVGEPGDAKGVPLA